MTLTQQNDGFAEKKREDGIKSLRDIVRDNPSKSCEAASYLIRIANEYDNSFLLKYIEVARNYLTVAEEYYLNNTSGEERKSGLKRIIDTYEKLISLKSEHNLPTEEEKDMKKRYESILENKSISSTVYNILSHIFTFGRHNEKIASL